MRDSEESRRKKAGRDRLIADMRADPEVMAACQLVFERYGIDGMLLMGCEMEVEADNAAEGLPDNVVRLADYRPDGPCNPAA